MKRRTWYKFHKWIGIGTGAALLIWCGTGIIMVLPHIAPSVSELPGPQQIATPADYRTVTVSPAEATEALVAAGRTAVVNDVFLRRIGERVVYDLRMDDGTRGLVDARTGATFSIDSTAAVELARMASGSEGEVIGFTRVEQPNSKYPFGEFPAYTIEFSDNPSLAMTTAIATGQVMRSGSASRIRVFIGNLHTFKQLGRFISSAGAYWTLVILTVFTTVGTVIGLWIALPKTWLPVGWGGVGRRAKAAESDDNDANYDGDR